MAIDLWILKVTFTIHPPPPTHLERDKELNSVNRRIQFCKNKCSELLLLVLVWKISSCLQIKMSVIELCNKVPRIFGSCFNSSLKSRSLQSGRWTVSLLRKHHEAQFTRTFSMLPERKSINSNIINWDNLVFIIILLNFALCNDPVFLFLMGKESWGSSNYEQSYLLLWTKLLTVKQHVYGYCMPPCSSGGSGGGGGGAQEACTPPLFWTG